MHQWTRTVRTVAVTLSIVTLSIVTLTGCGPDDGKFPVSGTVRYEGQPVADGIITFVPSDGSAPESIAIQGGIYEIRVPAGESLIRIYANRAPTEDEISARKKDPMWASDGMTPPDQPIQYIPEICNTASTLRVEVPVGGKADLNFDLKKPE
ncbi:MAG: hypothetical protein Q4C47_03095 [Planctomycetia bacterium]|nr:hypothetical protein [Planctomycetia bacterium]